MFFGGGSLFFAQAFLKGHQILCKPMGEGHLFSCIKAEHACARIEEYGILKKRKQIFINSNNKAYLLTQESSLKIKNNLFFLALKIPENTVEWPF